MHPAACPCTPLVYSHNIPLKKRAHTRHTAQKNVRPSTEMCAPGAVCTLNFEHCKLLVCALTGCTSPKTVHPEIASCTLPIFSNNKLLKKRAHTGCTLPKIVHPASEMCAPGAGCTLNFRHCKRAHVSQKRAP